MILPYDANPGRMEFSERASDCPKSFIEWFAANAELKALGVKP